MEIQELSAAASASDPFLFVASTGNKNRKGLILQQDGWILSGFKANPIALWMHNHEMPIGTWEQVKVEGGELLAKLKLAARGTSAFIDTLWNLVEQKIVRAASVGFKPTDYDLQKDGSILIKKMELREISLVTVPGDADALRVLSAMPEDVRDRFVLGHERKHGKTADPPKTRRTVMPTLAEKIRDKDADLTATKDRITTLTQKDDLTDDETIQLETLSQEAESIEKALTSLRRAEQALALGAQRTKPGGGITTPATAKKSREKAELLFRAAYVIAKGHVTNRSLSEIMLSDFGGDKELEVMTLAASAPAMTGVAGWAAELIETQIGEFLDLLSPESVWAKITGLRVVFDRMGAIRLPGRTVRGLGGNFVGEGAPIPVKQTVLSSVLLSPFKLGVITTMTRELAQRSSPAAEPLFRSMMIEDTAVTIDNLFMDNVAASALRPAGLQVLGTGSASAGSTVDLIITDLKTMVTNMINAGAGRRPIWVMNETTRIGLTLKPSSTTDSFPFKAEVLSGNLLGYPIISSITVPTGLVFLIDQAELAQGYGDSPAIEMSNQATLHMEDTAPAAIGTTGTPTVVAAPTRSLFQTDSLALRLIWDITWALRRPGAVQFRTGVAW